MSRKSIKLDTIVKFIDGKISWTADRKSKNSVIPVPIVEVDDQLAFSLEQLVEIHSSRRFLLRFLISHHHVKSKTDQ